MFVCIITDQQTYGYVQNNSEERVLLQGAAASHGVTSNAEAAALQQPEHL